MATMVYPELYTKGTRVWIKHPELVWQCAEIRQDFDPECGKLEVWVPPGDEEPSGGAGDGRELTIPVKDLAKDLPPLRNPDILIGCNDLTSLSYLHEPSVLYNLRVRFLEHQQIYTWCGIVLVAINPFTDLEIYGHDTIEMYHSNLANLAQLDPHIYAVAEDAFTKLECNNTNQSVIVSGESGAGKTVSAKFAMRYLASIAGSESAVEDRVLASNPIMEAIGNAKTVRNDNSSRFGKYIQILFDRRTRRIVGGNMRTYLLEKSRVTNQSLGERNFHIFYQLVAHANQCRPQLDHLGLSDGRKFAYLACGDQPSAYDDMSRLLEALTTLGFDDRKRNVLFSAVAAILHGGNIGFADNPDNESCTLRDAGALESLQTFCRLLDLNESATLKWLTSRLLKTGGREIITTPLTAQTAQYGLEALLKFVYEQLFKWIVSVINQSLGPPAGTGDAGLQFIGVLDIYGFEHFEQNSFEQFCINYANEVLQQQFNLHVFKLEQDEYVREGIDWQFVTFTDNQPVIDLIESRPIGILCLLDEECRMPQGTDKTWCSKLYKQIGTGPVFRQPKFNYQNNFIIEHFAEMVTYSVDGFLEKNRDTIWEEQIDLLRRSTVLECLFGEDVAGGGAGIGATPDTPRTGAGGKIKLSTAGHQQQQQKKKAKATIGFQFRESLDALMRILNATEPHYVRCIKPNDDKRAFQFNNVRAVQQLRACGVLETIRISSNGYPSRWSYQEFATRYRVLRVGHHHSSKAGEKKPADDGRTPPRPTPRKLVRAGSSFAMEIRAICEDVVRLVYEDKVYSHFKLTNDEQQQQPPSSAAASQAIERKPYQFGKTKIFFRPGQVALMERIRSQKLRECATLIQKIIRGWLARRRYQRIRRAALILQRYWRGGLARRHYQRLRKNRAALVIQTAWRRHYQQQRYRRLRNATVGVQARCRGWLARQRFRAARENQAAIIIQRYWRGQRARRQYHLRRRQIVLVQSSVRRFLAKRQYRRLRIEARSVEHVTNLNRGLEKKIITLQQRLDELVEENRALRLTDIRYQSLRHDMEATEAELANLRNGQRQMETDAAWYRSQLEQFKAAKQELIAKVDALERTKIDLEEKMRAVVDKQKRTVIDAKRIKDAVQERERQLREEFERERKMLIAERDREQQGKQQLLTQYMDLEGKGVAAAAAAGEHQRHREPDFGSDLERISVMMRCTELEQEMDRIQAENQKLREQLARNVKGGGGEPNAQPNAAALLLTQQFRELQEELARYQKERADLKRVILIEDRISTFNGDPVQKQKLEEDLISTYKSLYSKLDDQISAKDQMLQKLRDEIVKLRGNNNNNNGLIGSAAAAILPVGGEKQEMWPMTTAAAAAAGADGNHHQCSTYLGMFKFRPSDTHTINRILFYDFDPTNMKNVNSQCDSHTIAFITYMCLRYVDHINHEKMSQNFMAELITWLKKKTMAAITKNNLEISVHVFACAFKISILIKYYSEYESPGRGRETASAAAAIAKDVDVDEAIEADVDTDLDSIQSLKNFDLSDYIKLLKDLMIWNYSKMVKIFLERINPLIVAAVLEHQELTGSSMRRRKDGDQQQQQSGEDSGPPSPTEREIHTLFKELSQMQALFRAHQLDEHLLFQFFKQVYCFIGTTAINNLIMRKDLCSNQRAIEIIYNVSLFEQFLRENNIMNWEEVKSMMDPILQASKLLISTKTEKQISAIILTTEALSVAQILKIINAYTPTNDEQISRNFIKKLTTQLYKERIKTEADEARSKLLLYNANALPLPLTIPIIDMPQDTNVSVLQAAGLQCNFAEIEIPLILQRLERYLEKM